MALRLHTVVVTMRTLTTMLTAFTLSLTVGCATEPDSASGPFGGGGGKADGVDGYESLALRLTTDDEQQYLRAADAECLHRNILDVEPYAQAISLFCLPRGGVAAPLAYFIGVVPVGERGGAYQVYEIGRTFSDGPRNLAFRSADRTTGAEGILTFDAPGAFDEDLVAPTASYRLSVKLSGDEEDPTVAASIMVNEH